MIKNSILAVAIVAAWACASVHASASAIYRVTLEGTWTGGDPTLIGSDLNKPFRWAFLFDATETPTEDFNNDAANAPPEAQHSYAPDGRTKTLFLDADASSAADEKLDRTGGNALRLQLTNDLTDFFGPIPPTDLGSWIGSVVTSIGPKDIRLDTPLEPGYQNSVVGASLAPPSSAAELEALFTEPAVIATHTVSVTGFPGGAGADPSGPLTAVTFIRVPEPTGLTLAVVACFVATLFGFRRNH